LNSINLRLPKKVSSFTTEDELEKNMQKKTDQSTLKSILKTSASSTALALLVSNAWAVNGIQLNGYGIKNAGMGGVSIAMPLDASAPVNNPAGLGFVPTSYAVNLVAFSGNTTASVGPAKLRDNTAVMAPEGGFAKVLNPEWTVGVTLSGAGAGSDYGAPLPLPPGTPVLGTAQNLKSSRKIAEIAHTAAWKPRADFALGLSVIYAKQELNSQGLLLAVPDVGMAAIPSHGTQSASGWSARIGALWNVTPELSLGTTYRSKTSMSAMSGYSQDILLFSQGKVDLPSDYGIGAAWKVTPTVTLAADWLQVYYAAVKANQDPAGPLWSDQKIFKIGAAWELNPNWTLRAGYSKNTAQIDSSRVSQNILSPAIDNSNFALGASMKLDAKSDISFSFDAAPQRTLTGTGASSGVSLQGHTQVLRLGYQSRF
jgi:long-chain fatty acid transport protein